MTAPHGSGSSSSSLGRTPSLQHGAVAVYSGSPLPAPSGAPAGFGSRPEKRQCLLKPKAPHSSSAPPSAKAASKYIGRTGLFIAKEEKLKTKWQCNCTVAKSRGNPNHASACEIGKWRSAVKGHYEKAAEPTEGKIVSAIGSAMTAGSGPWVFKGGSWIAQREEG